MIPGLSVEPAGTSNQVLEFVGDAFKQNPRQKKTSGYLPGAFFSRWFLAPPSRARPLLRGRLRTAATSKNLKHVQFHSNISVPRAWSRDSGKGTDREDTCPKEWCHTLRLKQNLLRRVGAQVFSVQACLGQGPASLREHFLDT